MPERRVARDLHRAAAPARADRDRRLGSDRAGAGQARRRRRLRRDPRDRRRRIDPGARRRGDRRFARQRRGARAPEALTTGVPYVALVASPTRGTAVRAPLEVPEELRPSCTPPPGSTSAPGRPRRSRSRSSPRSSPSATLTPSRSPTPAEPRSIPCAAWRSRSPPPRRSWTLDGVPVFFCGAHCRDTYAEQHALLTPARPYVTGLVLAAGGSKRLGRPSSCSRTATRRCSTTCSTSRASATSTSCCA